MSLLELRPADLPRLHDDHPVGMRCPECARQRTQVRTMRSGRPRRADAHLRPDRDQRARLPRRGSLGGASARRRRARRQPAARRRRAVAARRSPTASTGGCSTAGFLHAGLLPPALQHVLPLHPRRAARAGGRPRCASALIYFVSLLAGSFGALLLEPNALDGRRLGRDLRADGRGRRSSCATAGIEPDGERPRPLDRAQPADHLHRPGHLDRRPHRRPGRRRPGRARPVRAARHGAPAARCGEPAHAAGAGRRRRWSGSIVVA